MQSFVEFIAESFDSNVPVHWKLKSLSRAVPAFQVIRQSHAPDRAGICAAYLRRERARVQAAGYRIEGPHKVDPCPEWTLRRAKPSGWKE